MQRRHRSFVLGIVVALAVSVPAAVWAADQFKDVPASNTFHSDIGWLADAGITLGCNPPANDEFCPKDEVTREQMAAFLRRQAENQVVDAGALQGMEANQLDNRAHSVWNNGPIPVLVAPAETTVLNLELDPGNYVIMAKGWFTGDSEVSCVLQSAVASDRVSTDTAPNQNSAGTWMVIDTIDSPTTITMHCTAQSSPVNLYDAKLTAMEVTSFTNNHYDG